MGVAWGQGSHSQLFSVCHTADGGTAVIPNGSGKSGSTESTDGNNGAQGKSSLLLDCISVMHLNDNQ